MASQANSFGSTPTFKLFQRGMSTQTVKRFRGINAYDPLSNLGPDWAQDALNVIVGSDGILHKFRLPQKVTAGGAFSPNGPQTIFDFQQANGVRQIFANIATQLGYYTADGAVGPTIVSASQPSNAGPWSFVEVTNILFGVNGQKTLKWTGTDLLNIGIGAATVAPAIGADVVGNLSPTFGYEWAYSYKCSGAAPGLVGPSPIEVGTASPPSQPAHGAGVVNKSFQLTATALAPADPQWDTLVWFRTVDGGGDLFRAAEVNINTGVVTFNAASVSTIGVAPFLTIVDNTPDLPLVFNGPALDQTTRAPLINNPPLLGKYAAVGQGRVFLFNLPGAPQDIIYSGYERIAIGNPPECYPPNNRLRLAIGAEAIAGGGVIQAGVVAFSQVGKMYMLRGQIEDISDVAPVIFTQYLEELPWNLGAFSHATIKATPYGLIWLASDKTVQIFDGSSKPKDLSRAVYPILRNITPGSESACQAAYFNWLDRDWYCLLVPYNGATTPNRMIFWGLDYDNSLIDIFVSNIPADGVGTISTSTLQRKLYIGQQGLLYNLPTSSDTTGGISDPTIIPPTSGQLNAYWRSGYWGNDSPERAKMWRWCRVVTDAPNTPLVTFRLVDDDIRTFVQPQIIGPVAMQFGKATLNQRAKRVSTEIDFPVQDTSVTIMELQFPNVPSSDR